MTPENVLGILSPIIWALIVVVCVKYVGVVRRVNHDGEGGILALLALLWARPERGISPKATWFVVVVVVGAAMRFGDGVITPAISVISLALRPQADRHRLPYRRPTARWCFSPAIRTAVPFMLEHRWLKRRSFHERIVLLNLSRVQGPYADAAQRVKIEHLSEDPETSFFYADPKLVPAAHGMPRMLRWLFGVLARNSRPLPDDLQIPADRRVEIGLEVGI